MFLALPLVGGPFFVPGDGLEPSCHPSVYSLSRQMMLQQLSGQVGCACTPVDLLKQLKLIALCFCNASRRWISALLTLRPGTCQQLGKNSSGLCVLKLFNHITMNKTNCASLRLWRSGGVILPAQASQLSQEPLYCVITLSPGAYYHSGPS